MAKGACYAQFINIPKSVHLSKPFFPAPPRNPPKVLKRKPVVAPSFSSEVAVVGEDGKDKPGQSRGDAAPETGVETELGRFRGFSRLGFAIFSSRAVGERGFRGASWVGSDRRGSQVGEGREKSNRLRGFSPPALTKRFLDFHP